MTQNSKVFVGEEEWKIKHFARHILNNRLDVKTFTMLDLTDLVFKCEEWKRKMPRIKPYYAVKCNNNKLVIQILSAFGFGFDCASESEIDMVLSAGASPKSIIFAHTAKPQRHIEFAREKDVDLLTFDSKFELVKTKYYYPNARLIIRIKNEALIATCPLGQKYGCCPYTEAPNLLLIAKRLNLKVVGVSFHVGSGCGDDYAHAKGITIARKLFNLGKKLGHNMHILDIGGGFPGDIGTNIDEMSTQITESINKHFPEGCGVNIIAEPGRYFVASAFTLACLVHSARILYDGDKAKIMYFMDNGLYESFAGVMFNRLTLNPKPLDIEETSLSNASLCGPTCDGKDIVMENVMLPKMPLPSWLLFESFGAYTSTTSTNFNGFSAPDEYVFSTTQTWNRLCRLEKFKEYQIETVKLPKSLPEKWHHEGPQTEHLYTPIKSRAGDTEKWKSGKARTVFKDHIRIMLSPADSDAIYSP